MFQVPYEPTVLRNNWMVARLRYLSLLVMVVLVACNALVTSALGANATFKPLGTFDGTRSQASDVSDDGSVVVGTALDTNTGHLSMFRWTAGGAMLRSSGSEFVGVSGDGDIVVGASPLPGGSVAIRWKADGSVEVLDTLPGKTHGVALDASRDGAVVVGAASTLTGSPEAFRWTSQTGTVGLGGLSAGDVWSFGNGVSEDGSIAVGAARTSIFDPNGGYAFRWTAATGMQALERPANSTGAAATAVSANGDTIVGGMALAPAAGSSDPPTAVAFRWTQSDGMIGLGDLPGGRVASNATGVSADGLVVVGVGETFSNPGVGATEEAFYWAPGTGMVNLRDLLVSLGATGLDGWLLTDAQGVSADGLTIVGTGVHNGITEAYVATIPEPPTVLLFAAALAGATIFVVKRRNYSKLK